MTRLTIISIALVLLLSTVAMADTANDLIFIHHSSGSNWLGNSLDSALLAKDYIDERNDITYGTDVPPDAGRPDSLASTPGDNTNMNHWILWFNDYFQGVRSHDCTDGFNRIIMFKSCFPISDVTGDGTEPGDPFSSEQTITNYKALYRHPAGAGNTYIHSGNGYTYKPLEDIFAEHPDILFIPITAPPLNYASTTDANAHRARLFNNWLKNDWLANYNAAHPGLNNVAVFDWFNVLAYPDNDPFHPNRLKAEYGGATGDSHPNGAANAYSTQIFATNPGNFIDDAWGTFYTPLLTVLHKDGALWSSDTGWTLTMPPYYAGTAYAQALQVRGDESYVILHKEGAVYDSASGWITTTPPYYPGTAWAVDLKFDVLGYLILHQDGALWSLDTGWALTTPPYYPGTAYARALEWREDASYVILHKEGAVYDSATGWLVTTPPYYPGTTWARDLKLVEWGYIVLHQDGAVWDSASGWTLTTPPYYPGADYARALELAGSRYMILHKDGAIYDSVDGWNVNTPPYYAGSNYAADLVVR